MKNGFEITSISFLQKLKKLCQQYNILLIMNEINTSLGRTGKLNYCDHAKIKPDILILGKSLSSGLSPISGLLFNDNITKHLCYKQHYSNFFRKSYFIYCSIRNT